MFQLFALVLRNADKSPVRPFIPCSARHFCKGAKFAGSVGHPMTKMLSASGGLRPPDPLTRGSAPGPRWGLCSQTPVIGSRSAFAMGLSPPKLKILATSLVHKQVTKNCFVIVSLLGTNCGLSLGPTKQISFHAVEGHGLPHIYINV